MTFALSPGATLTGGRIRTTWRTFNSPAVRYLPAPRIRFGTVQSTSSQPLVEAWLTAARQRLDELASLVPGWDGAAAQAINPTYIHGVWEFVSSDLITSLQAKPDLVPTFDGGLYIEWHTESVDLIIEVGSAGVTFYACDNETNREVEGALGEHVDELTSVINKLGLRR